MKYPGEESVSAVFALFESRVHTGPLKFCSRGAVGMSDEKKGAGGRPTALVEGGKSTQLYLCKACPAKVKSFHLKRHYKGKTNFAYLIFVTRRCKFFLAGVNFFRCNAKNWQFTV